MFHLTQPTMTDLTQTDVDELQHFADREISAGRYIQGARLQTLLAVYSQKQERNYQELLVENEALARELRDEIEGSLSQLKSLDSQVAWTIEKVEDLLSRAEAKPKLAPEVSAKIDAAAAFRETFIQIHEALNKLTKDLQEHISKADNISRPI